MINTGVSYDQPQFILASRSPRRQELLTAAGYRFETIVADFDDTGLTLDRRSPARACEILARLKARATARLIGPQLILAADTCVTHQHHQLGKPRDANEARWMIEMLNHQEHEVITGVAICGEPNGPRLTFHDVATVCFHAGEAKMIDQYIDSGVWQGKAGGYNLSELTAIWPVEVSGDPTTVIGLPMQRVGESLRRTFGVQPVG